MNLALIHDWLNQLGGAEDVLEALVAVYPDAPLDRSNCRYTTDQPQSLEQRQAEDL